MQAIVSTALSLLFAVACGSAEQSASPTAPVLAWRPSTAQPSQHAVASPTEGRSPSAEMTANPETIPPSATPEFTPSFPAATDACPIELRGMLVEIDGDLRVAMPDESEPLRVEWLEPAFAVEKRGDRHVLLNADGDVLGGEGDDVRLRTREGARPRVVVPCGNLRVDPKTSMFPTPGGYVMCVSASVLDEPTENFPATIAWSIYYPADSFELLLRGANSDQPIRFAATEGDTVMRIGFSGNQVLRIERFVAYEQDGEILELTDVVASELGGRRLDTRRRDHFSGSCPG
jgi:hypothetical protein